MPLPNPLQIVVKEPFRYIDFSAVSNTMGFQDQRITITIRNLNEKQYRPLVVFTGAGENNRRMQASTGHASSRNDDDTLYSHRLESIQCLPDMLKKKKDKKLGHEDYRNAVPGGGIVLSCLFENSVGGPYKKSKILYEPKILRNDLENKLLQVGSEDLLDNDNDDGLLNVHIAKSYRVINVEIVQGRNLVAKDRQFGFVGKKTSSDPYVKVNLIGKDQIKWRCEQHHTQIQKKTLNPVWNELLQIKVPLNEPLTEGRLVLRIMDHDKGSLDDPMGTVIIPVSDIVEGRSMELSRYRKWHPVTPGEECSNSTNNGKGNGRSSYYCKNATGELLVSATVRNVDGRRTADNDDDDHHHGDGTTTPGTMEPKKKHQALPLPTFGHTSTSPTNVDHRRRATFGGPTPDPKTWPGSGGSPAVFRPSWLVK